jgi:hypothetical protein
MARTRARQQILLRGPYLLPQPLRYRREDGLLVRHLPVHGDGLDAQVVRQAAHGEGVEPVLVDHAQGGLHHALRGHRAAVGIPLPWAHVSSDRGQTVDTSWQRCYRNSVTATLLL